MNNEEHKLVIEDNPAPDPISSMQELDSLNSNVEGHWFVNLLRQPKYSVTLFVALLIMVVILIDIVGQSVVAQTDVPIQTVQATVDLDGSGFSPQTIQVKTGTEVTWENTSSSDQAIGANPYPTHSSLPQLVSGNLKPEDSYSYVFNKTGTFAYQDDDDPLINGTVVVTSN